MLKHENKSRSGVFWLDYYLIISFIFIYIRDGIHFLNGNLWEHICFYLHLMHNVYSEVDIGSPFNSSSSSNSKTTSISASN